jgi:7-keto-8-aminopelargonate synthetase-like enzyme
MANSETNPVLQINSFINDGRTRGLLQVVDEGLSHNGKTIVVDGKDLINFGSCGYMSLEFDDRVKNGGMEAIQKFGVQFSTTRAYLSNPLYPKLETLLEKIFEQPTLVSQTTTLGHLAALPILVDSQDAVLLDQQVHSSVQLAAKVLKANGTHVELVSHSNMARLERKILSLQGKHNKIWYMADGVYSMYGDFAPLDELQDLLNKYDQLNLYFDDAHGMSWMGKRGQGYVLEKMQKSERIYVVTGLAKGFGTGGGAIICPSQEIKQLIRNCGGTQIFSGPLQPPILGAAVSSAKIHLQSDFSSLQDELTDRIAFCNEILVHQPLPQMSATNSPIRFLGVGPTELAQEMVMRLMKEGFWINTAQFPAVAPNHAGLRFMLNRQTQSQDMEKLIEAINKVVYDVIGKDRNTISQIWKSFSKDYRYALIQG